MLKMRKIPKLDLHAHTTRCRHAQGSMEAYVKAAVKNGVSVYGFSDHAPLFWDAGYRMRSDEMAGYEAEFLDLKERYGDRLTLLLGYEMDYLPGKIDAAVLERAVDYRIGSVHFLKEWGFDNPEFIGEYAKRNLEHVWKDYFAAMREMAESGLFDIAGHFDLIKVFGHFKDYRPDDAVMEALEAVKKSGMTLEINTAGWRKPVGEQYPSLETLKAARALGIAVTFGSDAHDVCHVAQDLDRAYELARAAGYQEAVWYRNREKQMIKI